MEVVTMKLRDETFPSGAHLVERQEGNVLFQVWTNYLNHETGVRFNTINVRSVHSLETGKALADADTLIAAFIQASGEVGDYPPDEQRLQDSRIFLAQTKNMGVLHAYSQ